MNTRRRHTLNLLRGVVALLFASAFLSRCASMMPPTGGPIDSLPPVIVNMIPDNFSTNRPTVNHGKIYIEFDEFIQIKDQQKEFFTSPQMKKKPTITQRGRGIVIQLRDTLLPNTTYSLNFGSAIRDNNEGNPLYSMRYVFSTGPEIDSMVFSGYTADSYKADSVSKSFIWFFPADSVENVPEYDSTIFKYKPAVIARAETNGIFIAQNLKPIPYRIYAVEDKNDNQMYEPGSDQVGFLDGTYNPAEMPDFAIWYDSLRQYVTAEPQLYFRMFTDKAFRRQLLSESERPLQHKAMLYFGAANPRITSLRFDSIPEDRVIVDPQTEGRDTIALWFNVPSASLPDTIKGTITYFKHDTVNRLQEVTEDLKLPWRLIETKEQERERERLERERRKAEAAGEEWTEPEKENPFAFKLPLSGEINPEEHLTVDFDYPLARLDSAALLLTFTAGDQSIEDVPVHMRPDTAQLLRWHISAPWKLGGEYTLTIRRGFLERFDHRQVHGLRSREVRHGEDSCRGARRRHEVHRATARRQQLPQAGEAQRRDGRHPVQLRPGRRHQVPHHRGPQRQRQMGLGQSGGAPPARAGRILRQCGGRGHLRHENQLGDRVHDGHEPDLRPRHDAVAFAPAGRARGAAAAARGGEARQGGPEARRQKPSAEQFERELQLRGQHVQHVQIG